MLLLLLLWNTTPRLLTEEVQSRLLEDKRPVEKSNSDESPEPTQMTVCSNREKDHLRAHSPGADTRYVQQQNNSRAYQPKVLTTKS